MNEMINATSFMFNGSLYKVNDEVIILKTRNSWTLGKTAKIINVRYDKFDLIVYNAKYTNYHIRIDSPTFLMKKLNEFELELI